MPAHINAHGAGRQRADGVAVRQRADGGAARDDRVAWATTASFPPHPANVARSRLLTRTALAAWGAAQLADSAEVVVSELVTNALRHGGGPVTMALVLTGEALQISVSDGGAALPAPRAAADDEPGGRGLRIVDSLCDGWQVTARLGGKTVTCRLACGRSDTGPAGRHPRRDPPAAR